MNLFRAATPRHFALVLAAGAASAGPALAEVLKDAGTSITIYSSAQPGGVDVGLLGQRPGWGAPQVPGYAVVRDIRKMSLTQGRGEVRFTDVAAQIDPTTVSFTSLSDPTASVLEQNYQFDLVSPEKLMNRFIDSPIAVNVRSGDTVERITGTLLSSSAGTLVLKGEDGRIRMLSGATDVALPSLPDGLITRPTLVWNVASDTGGEQDVRVSYQTGGITWWADYNLTYADGKDANHGTIDVGAWVSILNQSGGTYKDAKLKLVAGDVHRAPKPVDRNNYYGVAPSRSAGRDEEGFQEKSFFEYHLYTLGRPATIPDNSTKQVELFPTARAVPCEKVLVYDGQGGDWWGYGGVQSDAGFGAQSKKDVDVFLRFENTKPAGMGMPLPAGRIRVSKLDTADGSLEFIGEDVIRHTPQGEQVLIKLGQAFDVVGERTQTNFKIDSTRKIMEESFQIKVRNRKAEPVTVIVQEHLNRWSAWEVIRQDVESRKLDHRTVHFTLDLRPDEERAITYTVRYTW